MNFVLKRIIGMTLVPCLFSNPLRAEVLRSAAHRASSPATPFTSQALQEPEASFAHRGPNQNLAIKMIGKAASLIASFRHGRGPTPDRVNAGAAKPAGSGLPDEVLRRLLSRQRGETLDNLEVSDWLDKLRVGGRASEKGFQAAIPNFEEDFEKVKQLVLYASVNHITFRRLDAFCIDPFTGVAIQAAAYREENGDLIVYLTEGNAVGVFHEIYEHELLHSHTQATLAELGFEESGALLSKRDRRETKERVATPKNRHLLRQQLRRYHLVNMEIGMKAPPMALRNLMRLKANELQKHWTKELEPHPAPEADVLDPPARSDVYFLSVVKHLAVSPSAAGALAQELFHDYREENWEALGAQFEAMVGCYARPPDGQAARKILEEAIEQFCAKLSEHASPEPYLKALQGDDKPFQIVRAPIFHLQYPTLFRPNLITGLKKNPYPLIAQALKLSFQGSYMEAADALKKAGTLLDGEMASVEQNTEMAYELLNQRGLIAHWQKQVGEVLADESGRKDGERDRTDPGLITKLRWMEAAWSAVLIQNSDGLRSAWKGPTWSSEDRIEALLELLPQKKEMPEDVVNLMTLVARLYPYSLSPAFNNDNPTPQAVRWMAGGGLWGPLKGLLDLIKMHSGVPEDIIHAPPASSMKLILRLGFLVCDTTLFSIDEIESMLETVNTLAFVDKKLQDAQNELTRRLHALLAQRRGEHVDMPWKFGEIEKEIDALLENKLPADAAHEKTILPAILWAADIGGLQAGFDNARLARLLEKALDLVYADPDKEERLQNAIVEALNMRRVRSDILSAWRKFFAPKVAVYFSPLTTALLRLAEHAAKEPAVLLDGKTPALVVAEAVLGIAASTWREDPKAWQALQRVMQQVADIMGWTQVPSILLEAIGALQPRPVEGQKIEEEQLQTLGEFWTGPLRDAVQKAVADVIKPRNLNFKFLTEWKSQREEKDPSSEPPDAEVLPWTAALPSDSQIAILEACARGEPPVGMTLEPAEAQEELAARGILHEDPVWVEKEGSLLYAFARGDPSMILAQFARLAPLSALEVARRVYSPNKNSGYAEKVLGPDQLRKILGTSTNDIFWARLHPLDSPMFLQILTTDSSAVMFRVLASKDAAISSVAVYKIPLEELSEGRFIRLAASSEIEGRIWAITVARMKDRESQRTALNMFHNSGHGVDKHSFFQFFQPLNRHAVVKGDIFIKEPPDPNAPLLIYEVEANPDSKIHMKVKALGDPHATAFELSNFEGSRYIPNPDETEINLSHWDDLASAGARKAAGIDKADHDLSTLKAVNIELDRNIREWKWKISQSISPLFNMSFSEADDAGGFWHVSYETLPSAFVLKTKDPIDAILVSGKIIDIYIGADALERLLLLGFTQWSFLSPGEYEIRIHPISPPGDHADGFRGDQVSEAPRDFSSRPAAAGTTKQSAGRSAGPSSHTHHLLPTAA